MAEERVRVCGSVHPATSDGFRALLTEANLREKDGYEIVTVVRLDKGIAVLFRLRRDPSTGSFHHFFGD